MSTIINGCYILDIATYMWHSSSCREACSPHKLPRPRAREFCVALSSPESALVLPHQWTRLVYSTRRRLHSVSHVSVSHIFNYPPYDPK